MYILLNGAFGVGKSTVARELQLFLPRAAIFDSEWIGFVLHRLPGGRVSDFQHLAVWRYLTVRGARLVGRFRSPVIIPMTFSELAYLEEVRSGLARSNRPVLHFCLMAPLEVIRERLALRGELSDDPRYAWVHRRAAECCVAHRAKDFSIHLSTETRSPAAIAAALAERIREEAE
jgi:predicted kinase